MGKWCYVGCTIAKKKKKITGNVRILDEVSMLVLERRPKIAHPVRG